MRIVKLPGQVAPQKMGPEHRLRYFHIDIAQVSTEQGKLHLFVAIDR